MGGPGDMIIIKHVEEVDKEHTRLNKTDRLNKPSKRIGENK